MTCLVLVDGAKLAPIELGLTSPASTKPCFKSATKSLTVVPVPVDNAFILASTASTAAAVIPMTSYEITTPPLLSPRLRLVAAVTEVITTAEKATCSDAARLCLKT